MNTKDGGPAFPVMKHHLNGHIEQVAYGASLRDYFAAKAMQGFCARAIATGAEQEFAEIAYRMADAMLAARATSLESGNV
jgi:hypothetical protein